MKHTWASSGFYDFIYDVKYVVNYDEIIASLQ
jgi:hypothetical protein